MHPPAEVESAAAHRQVEIAGGAAAHHLAQRASHQPHRAPGPGQLDQHRQRPASRDRNPVEGDLH